MATSLAREIETLYPHHVLRLRGNVLPLIRSALTEIKNRVGDRDGTGKILMRYLAVENEADYFASLDGDYEHWLPEEYVSEYANFANRIISETLECLPDNLVDYVRSVALYLCCDAIREMISFPEQCYRQRKRPTVCWNMKQREN